MTINVGPNNPSYGTVAGAGIYTIGDSVTVSATASTGYTFSKWVDDNNTILSTNNPYTFVAAANLNLTAIFLDEIGTNYTITVNVNDSTMGTATGAGTYTAGDLVTLTANPVRWLQFCELDTDFWLRRECCRYGHESHHHGYRRQDLCRQLRSSGYSCP